MKRLVATAGRLRVGDAVVRGGYHDRASLDAMLRETAAKVARMPVPPPQKALGGESQSESPDHAH